jgi:hypothetical protein
MTAAAELAHLFRALKAPAAARALPAVADRARDEGWSFERFAEVLLSTEVGARDSHGGEGRIKTARFPARKTLGQLRRRQTRRRRPCVAQESGRAVMPDVPPHRELPSVRGMGTSADRPVGVPGISAEREYQRRRNARRTRVRKRYGPLGAAVVSVLGEPGHIHARRQGAAGEIATANALRVHLHRTDVVVLHDRRIPCRGRWNIDHLAIGPGGVTVIDSKASEGTVQITTVGIVRKRELLLVNGRDRTSQLDGLERQLDCVCSALVRADLGEITVAGALCFRFMRRRWLHYPHAREGLIRVDDPRTSPSSPTGPVRSPRIKSTLSPMWSRARIPAS